jgi:hypothetical protein
VTPTPHSPALQSRELTGVRVAQLGDALVDAKDRPLSHAHSMSRINRVASKSRRREGKGESSREASAESNEEVSGSQHRDRGLG